MVNLLLQKNQGDSYRLMKRQNRNKFKKGTLEMSPKEGGHMTITSKHSLQHETLTTARIQYLLSKALYYGVQEIKERPSHLIEFSNMDDMKYLYKKIFPTFKKVNFVLEKGGESDTYEKAVQFGKGMRGQYILAQAFHLAMKYLKAKKDNKENQDIRDMKHILNNVMHSPFACFDMHSEFCKKSLVGSGDMVSKN